MGLKNCPERRRNNIVVQELNDELLIYDLNKNSAYCLNEISAEVWRECDGKKSVMELSRVLTEKTKKEISEELVWLTLHEIKGCDLIEESYDVPKNFGGISRREVLNKVAFSTLVALPIISSIIAPRAISAMSGSIPLSCASVPGSGSNDNVDGCPCNANADCCGVCGGANGHTCGGTQTPPKVAAAPICSGLVCPSTPGGGNNDGQTGCPCNANADCCGVCGGANGQTCGGPTKTNGSAAVSCP